MRALLRSPLRPAALSLLALSASACLGAPPPAHEQDQQGVGQRLSEPTPVPEPEEPREPTEPRESLLRAIDPGEIPARQTRYPEPERLVAIGDLHGDLAATERALRLAGAMDESGKWIGGSLVIVQTGDQLDRGDGEQAILELLARLQHEAKAAGGAIHILNGNHEFMNAMGDLRYVTPGGLVDFADAPGVDVDDRALDPLRAKVPKRAMSRVAAFLPGRPWAKELGKRNTVVVVGDTAFVHGGVTPAYADDITTLNREARAFLNGERSEPPKAIVDPDGPVWSRHYSDQPDASDCALLDQALAKLEVKRMVVGHTVHTEGIQSACDEKVWMVDVGMAAHYGGPTQVLVIAGAEVSVLAG